MKFSAGSVLVLGFLLAGPLYPQERTDTSSMGFLSVWEADSNTVAIIDSARVLVLPIDSAALTAGSHHLSVCSDTQWDGEILDTTVSIHRGTATLITIPPKHTYAVYSEPSGALVQVSGKSLGATPLRFTSDFPVALPLALSLSHYQTAIVEPPLQPVTWVRLRPDPSSSKDAIFEPSHSIRSYSGWVYGSIAAGIVTGTISVIAKNTANSYDAQFQETGNPSLRDKSKSYDTIAGATLLATEITFGVLSYLLLTQ